MNARNKGFEEFVPLYPSQRHWSDRTKSLDLPLFPGYIFCRTDLKRRMALLTIPGVLHFVGFGKVPTPIMESELSAIQTAVRSGLAVLPSEYVETGERVRMQAGPLKGIQGILAGTATERRLVVSMSLLKQSISVAIENSWAAVPGIEDSLMLRGVGETLC
jgi:transcription antitermination factor NusG